MLDRLRATLAAAFSGEPSPSSPTPAPPAPRTDPTPSPDATPATPPVDLNRPVENPMLVQAITRLAAETEAGDPLAAQTRERLWNELQRAVYLAAVLTDEMPSTPDPDHPGRFTVGAGGRLKFLVARRNGDDATHLPLFTDWRAIRAYTGEPVSGLVLRPADAWAMALDGDTYAGAVINPGADALPLGREMLLELSRAATPPAAGADADATARPGPPA